LPNPVSWKTEALEPEATEPATPPPVLLKMPFLKPEPTGI
jgi:hypothetical protein